MSSERSTMEEQRQANTEVVRQFIDAINGSWNMDVMRELVSDDFLFTIPFAPEWFPVRYEGRDGALAFIDGVREIMDPENLHDLRINSFATDSGELIAQYKSATRIKMTNLPYCNRKFELRNLAHARVTRFPATSGGCALQSYWQS